MAVPVGLAVEMSERSPRAHVVGRMGPPMEVLWEEQPEGRRQPVVWLGLVAATLSFQMAVYFGSGDECVYAGCYVHNEPCRLPRLTFYAVGVQDLVGPWFSAGLLGAVLDHRGRFCSESPLHVWTWRLAILFVLGDTLRLVGTVYCCHIPLSTVAPLLTDASFLLLGLRIVMTCWMSILKFHDLGQNSLARVCYQVVFMFGGSSALAVVTFRVHEELENYFEMGLEMTFISFSPVMAFVLTAALSYVAFLIIFVRGMLVAVRTAEAGLPFRQNVELGAAQRAIATARRLAVITAVSGVAMSLFMVVMVMRIQPPGTLPWELGPPLILLANSIHLMSHVTNVMQVLLFSALLGPEDARQSSDEAFVEMARLGGYAPEHERRFTLDEQALALCRGLPLQRISGRHSAGGSFLTPRRRGHTCLALVAAATFSFQLTIYITSERNCSAAWIGRRGESIPKEAFYGASLRDTLAPWATAALLGKVMDHSARCEEQSPLHLWAWRWGVCSALDHALFLVSEALACRELDQGMDPSGMFEAASKTAHIFSVMIICWMIVLKFRDMGHSGLARACNLFLCIFISFAMLGVLFSRVEHFRRNQAVHRMQRMSCALSWMSYFIFLAIAVCSMHHAARAAKSGLPDHWERESAAARRSLHWAQLTTGITALSGFLTIADGVGQNCFAADNMMGLVRRRVLTGVIYATSHALNCVQVALLSALLGPADMRQNCEEAFVEVGRLGGQTLGDGSRRITFQGHVSGLSKVCIVSFPGVYADLWAEVTRLQREQASVACVFLPSVSSGLGLHARDPENPDSPCYCSTIYPPFDESSYLKVIPRREGIEDCEGYQEQLAFERADAAAQGICLLVEADHQSCLLQRAKRRAQQKAQQLCTQNGCRAPWGCVWFDRWVNNVELAVRMRQQLIVFYKQNRTGCGKLAWHELNDVGKIAAASLHSGLGASQRVEVAYLDRKGYKYSELDVMEFIDQFDIGDGRAFTI